MDTTERRNKTIIRKFKLCEWDNISIFQTSTARHERGTVDGER